MTGLALKFAIALVVVWIGWRLWHGAGPWRGRVPGTPIPPRQSAAIDDPLAEARAVLGVEAAADAAAIRAAHRRLIAAVHPDKGGSAELTRRVNAARDMLLADMREHGNGGRE